MKIKIEEDVFDIANRIKDIDEEYFILFDTNKGVYEIHNYNQENTYCLTCPFDCLDGRIIDLIKYSSIENIDKILQEIDNNNTETETKLKDKENNQRKFMLQEIYKFASNSSKYFNEKLAFKNIWR